MRLGQLARKLALRPAEIVEFLALNKIQIDESANTRLEDEYVMLITRQFAPAIAEEFNSQQLEIPDAPTEKISLTEIEDTSDVSIPEDAPSLDEKLEVIKATKVALSGLKVLGKIELPEPKKTELPQELPDEVPAAVVQEKEPPRETRRSHDQKKPRPGQRPAKNPIALQREREAKEAEQKRQEKADREKERKTQNYLKKVKMSAPTKAVRLVEEPVMQMTAAELAEPPKTWLGKFLKWLTT